MTEAEKQRLLAELARVRAEFQLRTLRLVIDDKPVAKPEVAE